MRNRDKKAFAPNGTSPSSSLHLWVSLSLPSVSPWTRSLSVKVLNGRKAGRTRPDEGRKEGRIAVWI